LQQSDDLHHFAHFRHCARYADPREPIGAAVTSGVFGDRDVGKIAAVVLSPRKAILPPDARRSRETTAARNWC
jgi:hypothetical protein